MVVTPWSIHGAAISQQQDNNLMKQEVACWVEIYMNSGFDKNQPHLLLVGPHELMTLKALKDRNWDNDIESIIVGPRATVVVYEHTHFKGRELLLKPHQRVGSLTDEHLNNEIESLRVSCQ